MYCSSPYLEEFYRRATASAKKITADYELILVNDGSPDDSLTQAVELHERDDRVKVLDLSRNFGHHKAMMTGLKHSRGEWVFLIDCDLEEAPELLEKFHAELQRGAADVVYGGLPARKGGAFERLSGRLFYAMFNLLSTHPVPANSALARLMSRRYVNALVQHLEHEVFLPGLWELTGFRQVSVPAIKEDKGKSTYTLRRKVALFVNALTSFSNKPLVFIFYLGCAIVSLASIAALYLIVLRLFFGPLRTGWPSTIVSIWLLGGLNIFCLGVIGIYLSKVFTETKARPYTIIRRVYDRNPEASSRETKREGE